MPTTMELRQAWVAVQRGDFRRPEGAGVQLGATGSLVLVVGVAGQAGASTVALAVAEASGAASLWDCAPTVSSGLVGVSDRELGQQPSGWWQGYRGELRVERSPQQVAARPGWCPAPPAVDGLTIVDAGWDAVTLAHGTGWLPGLLTDVRVPVVVVARCSVPMMQRAHVVLDHLLTGPGRDVRLAVLGLPRRRWPRQVPLPPAAAGLEDQHRMVCVPFVDALAVTGLGVDPLPAPVVGAVKNLIKEGTLS